MYVEQGNLDFSVSISFLILFKNKCIFQLISKHYEYWAGAIAHSPAFPTSGKTNEAFSERPDKLLFHWDRILEWFPWSLCDVIKTFLTIRIVDGYTNYCFSSSVVSKGNREWICTNWTRSHRLARGNISLNSRPRSYHCCSSRLMWKCGMKSIHVPSKYVGSTYILRQRYGQKEQVNYSPSKEWAEGTDEILLECSHGECFLIFSKIENELANIYYK